MLPKCEIPSLSHNQKAPQKTNWFESMLSQCVDLPYEQLRACNLDSFTYKQPD